MEKVPPLFLTMSHLATGAPKQPSLDPRSHTVNLSENSSFIFWAEPVSTGSASVHQAEQGDRCPSLHPLLSSFHASVLVWKTPEAPKHIILWGEGRKSPEVPHLLEASSILLQTRYCQFSIGFLLECLRQSKLTNVYRVLTVSPALGKLLFSLKKVSCFLVFFFSSLPVFSAFWKGCLELFNLQYRSLENIASRLL